MADKTLASLFLHRLAQYFKARKCGKSHEKALEDLEKEENENIRDQLVSAGKIVDEALQATSQIADAVTLYLDQRRNGRNSAEASIAARPDYLPSADWDKIVTAVEDWGQTVLIHNSTNTPKPPTLQ